MSLIYDDNAPSGAWLVQCGRCGYYDTDPSFYDDMGVFESISCGTCPDPDVKAFAIIHDSMDKGVFLIGFEPLRKGALSDLVEAHECGHHPNDIAAPLGRPRCNVDSERKEAWR